MSNRIKNYDQWTPCEVSGHRYTFPDDPEVFTRCVDCGEEREADDEDDEDETEEAK